MRENKMKNMFHLYIGIQPHCFCHPTLHKTLLFSDFNVCNLIALRFPDFILTFTTISQEKMPCRVPIYKM